MLTLLKNTPLDDVASMYNRAVRSLKLPDDPVRRFRSRAQALEHVESLVQKYHLRVAGTDKRPRIEATESSAGEISKVEQPPEEDLDEASVLHVVKMPSALKGSLRARRIATLRDGMTVGQYLDAAYEANDKTRNRSRSKSDLLRFIAGGFVLIDRRH